MKLANLINWIYFFRMKNQFSQQHSIAAARFISHVSALALAFTTIFAINQFVFYYNSNYGWCSSYFFRQRNFFPFNIEPDWFSKHSVRWNTEKSDQLAGDEERKRKLNPFAKWYKKIERSSRSKSGSVLLNRGRNSDCKEKFIKVHNLEEIWIRKNKFESIKLSPIKD